jgi:hypothetical protein
MKIEKGKRGRKRNERKKKEREERTVTVPQYLKHISLVLPNVLSALLDTAVHIVGPDICRAVSANTHGRRIFLEVLCDMQIHYA